MIQARTTLRARFLAACASLLIPAFAAAQESTDDRLLACNAIENEEERLACFDQVVRGLGPERTSAPAAAAPPEPPQLAAPPEPPPAAAPSMREAAPVAPAMTPEPEPAPAARAAEPPPEPSPEKKSSGDLTGTSVVTQVWPQMDGRFTVRLENGQVWRETEGTRVGMPDVGASVEITRSLFGSYRMKIEGIPQLAWVREPE